MDLFISLERRNVKNSVAETTGKGDRNRRINHTKSGFANYRFLVWTRRWSAALLSFFPR